MSALPPKADITVRVLDVCFGPQADSCSAAKEACEHRLSDSDNHRANEVFEGSRGLFRRVGQERRSVDLNEITIEVLQSLRGELKEHGVTTRTELTSELPAVDGNKSQLQQVIFNLVRNALEAMDTTTDRTRVLKARMERHGCDAIIVAVEDSGPGIDPKKLGLAICRMIIERHEGQLSASLVDPRGTVFRIVLPVGRFGVV